MAIASDARISALLFALLLLGCIGTGSVRSDGSSEDRFVDGQSALPSVDAGGEEARVDVTSDGYVQGIYECCAKGQGRSCCGSKPVTACLQYGGNYGDCLGEGQTFEGKSRCAICCPGLVERSTYVFDTRDGGMCIPEATVSTLICISCGDGKCGPGENRCRCPEDCPE